MKRIQYLLLLLILVSCNKQYSTIEINKTSCETISPTDTVHVDSMIPMNLFLYKQYIVTTAPQSNFAKTPYELYDKDNLRFIARAGAFGHSGNEVIDVNPYFIDRNENSFYQCVYGNYLTECTFREGKLNIIEKKTARHTSHQSSVQNRRQHVRYGRNRWETGTRIVSCWEQRIYKTM